jgi:hypothetical protein
LLSRKALSVQSPLDETGDADFLISYWQGTAFVLSTATGKSEIVDNLAHLWMAAERLLGRPCNPLDEELIALMERELG